MAQTKPRDIIIYICVIAVAIPLYMILFKSPDAEDVTPVDTVVNSVDNTANAETSSKISLETQKEIVAYFKSDAEPQIKDAAWSDNRQPTLFLGAINDGANRDGLADYACQVLIGDFGLPQGAVHVYIMDIAKIVNGGKWIKLGQSACTYN